MRIEIVIDELVLHGVDPRDRHRVADALERELTRLAASDPQRWRGLRATDLLHAPEFVVPESGGGSTPATLGAQLAGALAVTLAGAEARAPQASSLPGGDRRATLPLSAGLPGSNRRGTP